MRFLLIFLLGSAVNPIECSRWGDKKGKDRKRVLNDIFIHSDANGFDYDLQLANEFQQLIPSNIQHRSHLTSETYTITNISPLVINSNDVVTVQFETTDAYKSDWIGAYSPPDANISTTTPVKYAYCNADSSYLSTKSGTLLFNFTNLRAGIQFYYFTNGIHHPAKVDQASDIVNFRDVNEPLKPRIVGSPTGDADSFQLLWSSNHSDTPQLQWGTASGSYDHYIDASTSMITQEDLCGPPANAEGWRELGAIHTANLSNVRSLSTNYVYYKFGDNSTNIWSKEYRFRVPPAAGKQPDDRATTVILYDDLGRGSLDMSYTWNEYGRPAVYTAMSVGEEVRQGNVDAVYHGGDLSYATGYMAVWDFYLDMMGPVAGQTVYLTTVGNHESDWPGSPSYYQGTDSGGECGVPATKLMPMPYPASTNEPWWSYEVGLIHMIGISTEHNYTTGSPQWEWLKNDLENIDRSKTPWVIFGGHRAMYINSDYRKGDTVSCKSVNKHTYTPYQDCTSDPVPGTSDGAVSDLMIEHLEPLLHEHKVDIGFYGHNHAVQRHSAVYNRTVVQKSIETLDGNGNTIHWHQDPTATVHMVIGTGGAFFTKNAVQNPPPEWNELFFYEYGYAKVTATSPSELKWEWILSESNQVVDTLVITQSSRSPSNDEDISDGAKAGIVIGVLAFVMGCSYALWYFRFRPPKSYTPSQSTSSSTSPFHDASRSTSAHAHAPSTSLISGVEASDNL